MRHTLLLVVLVAIALMPVRAQTPAGPGPSTALGAGALSQRIAHTDPAAYRPAPAVHGGAGTMSFTALLNRGAVTPEFNFLHRGVIPAGAGIGHHFHNVVEEMFVILDGEAPLALVERTEVRLLALEHPEHGMLDVGAEPSCLLHLLDRHVNRVLDGVRDDDVFDPARASFPDEIARCAYPVDIHSASTGPEAQKTILGLGDAAYKNTGNGDGGFLSVGAENNFGTSGQNTYFNGTGIFIGVTAAVVAGVVSSSFASTAKTGPVFHRLDAPFGPLVVTASPPSARRSP